MKPIGHCECGNLWENPDTGLCATCNKIYRKTRQVIAFEPAPPIKKRSEVMQKMMAIYKPKAARFLVGRMCAVFPEKKATQVHHMYNRSIDEFADEWAVEHNIPYLLDERFFLGVSEEGHNKITADSAWAWEQGFSFKRVGDPMFHKKLQQDS